MPQTFLTRIAVIDYGMGNLHSVASALKHVAPEADVIITANTDEIDGADRVIFPGVGAMRDCMAEILRGGFDQCVHAAVEAGKPVLGICVGMQALMSRSEENGGVDCLNLLPGQVKHFDVAEQTENSLRLKVPHMGWNQVAQCREHPLWQGIENNSRFYFVHSYYAEADDAANVYGRTSYSVDFDVALGRNNLFAVQFHPEKSHTVGLQLLKNFVHWNGRQ